MIEFIDKTATQSGTPINRVNLLAIQGFVAKTTVFESDRIIETNGKGETLTTVFSDNIITETFKGKYTITKTTTFDAEGNITEVVANELG